MSSRAAPQPVMTSVASIRTFAMGSKTIIFTEAHLMKNPCTVQTRIVTPATWHAVSVCVSNVQL